MVHRVYMCSNRKSPLVVQEFNQVEGCNNSNHILSTSPSFIFKKQVNFQEGKRYQLLPKTCPPTKLKPRTVCCQGGEDDEDMKPMDTTMIAKYKVSSFLYLHNDFLVQFIWFHLYMSIFDCRHKCKVELLVRQQTDNELYQKSLCKYRNELTLYLAIMVVSIGFMPSSSSPS